MMRVFIDTGAWLALVDRDDQYHAAVRTIYRALLEDNFNLVTTNLIIAETYNLIRRRMGHQVAMKFLQSIRSSARLTKVYSNDPLEKEAETILARFADQDFSFVDAVSFTWMEQAGVRRAFAFDKHFFIAGFELLSY